ncbi:MULTISPECIES: hypothetical protein [Rhodobacterales]|uniref:hypothetical protein n=1 Tax=Rhodobacterales TaxID=204455 RepID=UPI00237F7CFF|nr:hypothetical protein [Phaeobacter gallaeciensis]MDE4189576.1 hypothetical protein [Phaeobacter gallaeciensis]MDE4198728.1 hypothetical protein [Phaeobacter gallaeciensis]MDE4202873.1 hypothetical protein [Phaeobacter gallaeciensis]MDE4207017.1 hypothetical protein [Phaeobacter gallaeciensis]MDE4215758.1 hypothetical protein [Phaeobacter gallaeciensis]
MHYAGAPLVSKATATSGRACLSLAVVVVLTTHLEIDTSSLEFLGISFSESQLSSGTFWVQLILIFSLTLNWIGDLISLAKWNSSMTSKGVATLFGGGGTMKGRLEFVIEHLERAIDPENEIEKGNLSYVKRQLEEINCSLWWHEKYAILYVVGLHFLLPVSISLWAICELI